MFLKIGGASLIMMTTVLTGLYYGNLETYRVNDLQEMKKALCILKAEIEFSLMALPEALINVGNRTKKPVAQIFSGFAELLATNRKEDIAFLWASSLDMRGKETYFNKEDLDAFLAFGKTLGYLDKSMQSTSILVTIHYIDSAVARLNETRSKNKKLFNSLGILCGILTIVILI